MPFVPTAIVVTVAPLTAAPPNAALSLPPWCTEASAKATLQCDSVGVTSRARPRAGCENPAIAAGSVRGKLRRAASGSRDPLRSVLLVVPNRPDVAVANADREVGVAEVGGAVAGTVADHAGAVGAREASILTGVAPVARLVADDAVAPNVPANKQLLNSLQDPLPMRLMLPASWALSKQESRPLQESLPTTPMPPLCPPKVQAARPLHEWLPTTKLPEGPAATNKQATAPSLQELLPMRALPPRAPTP